MDNDPERETEIAPDGQIKQLCGANEGEKQESLGLKDKTFKANFTKS